MLYLKDSNCNMFKLKLCEQSNLKMSNCRFVCRIRIVILQIVQVEIASKFKKKALPDTVLLEWIIAEDSIPAKAGEVNCFELLVDDQLHDSSANCGSHLNAVATESGGPEEVVENRILTNDWILIHLVVVVIACPCTF